MNIKRALIDVTSNELSNKIEQELKKYCLVEMQNPTNINFYVYKTESVTYQLFLIKPDAPRNLIRLYKQKSSMHLKNPENNTTANTLQTININLKTNITELLI